MRSNCKAVRDKIKLHILDCTFDANFKNFEACAIAIYKEFMRVTDNSYCKHHFPNQQLRFSNYLDGLPYDFYFYYSDINNYLDTLGLNKPKRKITDEDSEKLYHYLIFSEVIKAVNNAK
jgi:hypothetical protein